MEGCTRGAPSVARTRQCVAQHMILWCSGMSALVQGVRVYPWLNSPDEHPTWHNRHTKPPLWTDFPEWPVFGGPRYFGELMSDPAALEEHFHQWKEVAGCSMVWPSSDSLCKSANQTQSLLSAVSKLNMTLGQLNGFHPAEDTTMSNMTSGLCGAGVASAQKTLGSQWLGVSSCEQGGRYIDSYSSNNALLSPTFTFPLNSPSTLSDNVATVTVETQQMFAFLLWMDKMYDYTGRRLVGLATTTVEASLWAGSGFYTAIGSETAQSGGSVHVTYAFNRGAAKQHGIQVHADVSIFTRYGHKVPGDPSPTPQCNDQSDHSDICGTSYNLLKRLLYTESLYTAVWTTVEGGFFYGRADISKNYTLTPIGRIVRGARAFFSALANGNLSITPTATPTMHVTKPSHPFGGFVHLAPVAVLHDAHSGWNIPCQGNPVTPHYFRSWGNIPWDRASFFLDGVLNVSFPGYARGSWYRDESGYLGPTPFGDGVDVIGDDAAGWLLARYDTILVTGTLRRSPVATRNRLQQYLQTGGNVVITASSLATIGTLSGMSTVMGDASNENLCTPVSSGSIVELFDDGSPFERVVEPFAFKVCPYFNVSENQNASKFDILASVKGRPLVVRVTEMSGGSLTVLLSGAFATAVDPVAMKTGCGPDQETDRPYPLLMHARQIISHSLEQQSLFDVGSNDLSWSVLRQSGDSNTQSARYMVAVSNPTLTQQSFGIQVGAALPNAKIVKSVEINIDQSEKGCRGYWPLNFTGSGQSDANTIAGGDLRLFLVDVSDADDVKVLAKSSGNYSRKNTWLRLANVDIRGLRAEIWRRPSLLENVDGLVVDWRFVQRSTHEALAGDGRFLKNRGFAIAVDATSAIDVFPGWRLCNDSVVQYTESMTYLTELIAKLPLLGAQHMILSTHQQPEGCPFSGPEFDASVTVSLQLLADQAAAYGITLYLRQTKKNYRGGTYAACLNTVSKRVNRSNFKLAASTALLIRHNNSAAVDSAVNDVASGLVPMVLVAAPVNDVINEPVTDNGPVANLNLTSSLVMKKIIEASDNTIVVLDASFMSVDSEVQDIAAIQQYLV